MHRQWLNRNSKSCHLCFPKGHDWQTCDTCLFWQEMGLYSDKSELFKLFLIGKLSNTWISTVTIFF